MILKRKYNLLTFVVLPCAWVLAACQPAVEDRSDDEIVLERAQLRWDLVVDQDFEHAYEFYSPGFREMTGVGAFRRDMQNLRIRYTEAEVLSADCDEQLCEVQVRVSYRVPEAIAGTGMSRIPGERVVRENWIRTGGGWWFSPPR